MVSEVLWIIALAFSRAALARGQFCLKFLRHKKETLEKSVRLNEFSRVVSKPKGHEV